MPPTDLPETNAGLEQRPELIRADARSATLRAVATAIFVTVLWSSSWILIRKGLDDEELAPITFAGLRYSLAAWILLGWIGVQRRHRVAVRGLDRQLILRLALLGVVYYAITQGAQFVAIDAQPAATSSLMLAPTAFGVALLSGRTLGERPMPRQYVGAALVVAGAFVYFSGELGATVLGMVASVAGLLANIAGSLLGRSTNRSASVSPVVVTGVSMAVGASLLLGSGVAIEGWPSMTGRLLAIIIWLAVVNTALAFTLWNLAQRHLTAVESSAINNTMLIQIVALAWAFLGEAPGRAGVVGILIVSGGAYLAQGATRSLRWRPHAR